MRKEFFLRFGWTERGWVLICLWLILPSFWHWYKVTSLHSSAYLPDDPTILVYAYKSKDFVKQFRTLVAVIFQALTLLERKFFSKSLTRYRPLFLCTVSMLWVLKILSRIPGVVYVTDNSTRVRIGYRIYSLWRFITTQITITNYLTQQLTPLNTATLLNTGFRLL
jgi:hypothetical protein